MRTIKFRGMGIDGEWHYGDLSVLKENLNYAAAGVYISNCLGMPLIFEVRPETVGQYTGLKDSKGTEIYEGDIVKYIYGDQVYEKDEEPETEDERIEVVKFHEGEFSPVPKFSYCEDGYYGWQTSGFVVIGNIHENPELLRGDVK